MIGKGLGPQFEDPPREIVGIVGDVHGNRPRRKGCRRHVRSAEPGAGGAHKLANSVIPLSWAVRTAGDPMAVRAAVEREVHAVDAHDGAARMRTMEQVMAQALSRAELQYAAAHHLRGASRCCWRPSEFTALMAYSVEQRMQEIGIRMALGAGRGDVLKLIVLQGMKLAWIGVGHRTGGCLRRHARARDPAIRREVQRPGDLRRGNRSGRARGCRRHLRPGAAGVGRSSFGSSAPSVGGPVLAW